MGTGSSDAGSALLYLDPLPSIGIADLTGDDKEGDFYTVNLEPLDAQSLRS